MDVLSSSTSMSKAFQFHCLPLSSSNQPRTCNVKFGYVSCRSTTTQENLYKILSVSPGSATRDEIKRAYRSMALQYHPDVCHDPSMKDESTRMFVQLNAAYETLSNPSRRAQYDSELGLGSIVSNVSSDNDGERYWGSSLQEEEVEVKTRSRRRMGQKGGSSCCRMRTHNMKHRH